MGCCPICETDTHRCTCPDNNTLSWVQDSMGDTSPVPPTKEKPITVNGFYMWEDWEGNIQEEKLQLGLIIMISEEDTPETVRKRIIERLYNA